MSSAKNFTTEALKAIGYTFKGENSFKIVLFPFEKESVLKGKNMKSQKLSPLTEMHITPPQNIQQSMNSDLYWSTPVSRKLKWNRYTSREMF